MQKRNENVQNTANTVPLPSYRLQAGWSVQRTVHLQGEQRLGHAASYLQFGLPAKTPAQHTQKVSNFMHANKLEIFFYVKLFICFNTNVDWCFQKALDKLLGISM